MEHPTVSPISGILTELSCSLNDIVADGANLAVVENPNEKDITSTHSGKAALQYGCHGLMGLASSLGK